MNSQTLSSCYTVQQKCQGSPAPAACSPVAPGCELQKVFSPQMSVQLPVSLQAFHCCMIKQQSTLGLPQEKNSETRRMSMIESELLPLGSVLLKRKQHVRFDSIVYVTTTEEIWNLRTSESFKNVYRNIICNDQNIETTQMPFDWGANETFPDDGICSAVKN